MLDCKRINPIPLEEGLDAARAWGFTAEDKLVDLSRAMQAKQRFGEWWKRSREG